MAGHYINRWSKVSDACTQCGTKDRPHEARGMCKRCYFKWRRKNDPAWAQAQRDRSKANRFKFAEKQEAYFAEYRKTEHYKAVRRRNSRDWLRKHRTTKWKVGMTVWVDYGLAWVKGTIIERPNRNLAVVQLTKSTIRITPSKLRAEDPNVALGRAA